MTRLVTIVVSLGLVGLCLLALDDITTGDQPDFFLEWLMVAVTSTWFGLLTVRALGRS